MMKLETMRVIVDSLQEQTPLLVQTILSRWNDDIQDVRYIRSSANFVFSFRMLDEPYFLRFNHEDERAAALIEQELAFVLHLADRGLKVAGPVPSRQEAFVETVSSALGTFHATVFEALEGQHYELDDLTPEQLLMWGETFGKLHHIASTYPATQRLHWREQLAWFYSRLQGERDALEVARRLKQKLSALPTTSSNYGLLHADFELDNLVWQGNEAAVLDFDDCTYSWFVADIAYALRDVFGDDPSRVDLSHPTLHRFVEGYRTVRPLPDEELALLPVFLCFHNLFMFTRLLRALENLEKRNQPEWVETLSEKLKHKLVSYRDQFGSVLTTNIILVV